MNRNYEEPANKCVCEKELLGLLEVEMIMAYQSLWSSIHYIQTLTWMVGTCTQFFRTKISSKMDQLIQNWITDSVYVPFSLFSKIWVKPSFVNTNLHLELDPTYLWIPWLIIETYTVLYIFIPIPKNKTQLKLDLPEEVESQSQLLPGIMFEFYATYFWKIPPPNKDANYLNEYPKPTPIK